MARTIILNATLWGRNADGDAEDIDSSDFMAEILPNGWLDLNSLFERASVAVALRHNLHLQPQCERLNVTTRPDADHSGRIIATLMIRRGGASDWHIPVAALRPIAEPARAVAA